MDEVRLNVRVERHLLERVKIACVKARISMSDLVRDLLEGWLAEQESQQKSL